VKSKIYENTAKGVLLFRKTYNVPAKYPPNRREVKTALNPLRNTGIKRWYMKLKFS